MNRAELTSKEAKRHPFLSGLFAPLLCLALALTLVWAPFGSGHAGDASPAPSVAAPLDIPDEGTTGASHVHCHCSPTTRIGVGAYLPLLSVATARYVLPEVSFPASRSPSPPVEPPRT